MTKKIFYTVVSLLVLAFLSAGLASRIIDKNLNGVLDTELPKVSQATQELHSSLLIMDWHSDALLWNRNLLARSTRGHVDLPRLQAGNVALQMFSMVSKSPFDQNDVETDSNLDRITPLIMMQGWPVRTWDSLFERALYQAKRLQQAVDASNGQLMFVRNQQELEFFLAQRQKSAPPVIAAMLGSEGSHVLEGELDNLDRLYDEGLRLMGLQHFFDNRAGGSMHGTHKTGLTAFGRELVAALNNKNIIIDLAHSSEAVVEDVLAISQKPSLISHTGVYGACNSPRNLPDKLLKSVADKGGLIAIGFWNSAICDVSPEGIAKSIQYSVELLGEDHVALGSDFDGAVTTPFDAANMAQLTQALLDVGLSEVQIRKVMGDNSLRFLQQQLPSEAL